MFKEFIFKSIYQNPPIMKKTSTMLLVSSFLFFSFTTSDDPFFLKASQLNLSEIQTGKLAQSKGGAFVKSYGGQMVTDHTLAQDELSLLANKHNLNLLMKPDVARQTAFTSLNSLSGNAFDSAYLRNQQMQLRMAISLFKEESVYGTDPAGKTYANKYLPILQKHVKLLQTSK
jgi:putative membrane protein